MAVDRKLPPPGASQKEVLFRRLLLQCEKHVNQSTLHEGEEEWQRNLKLHSYVEYLKELLYDLENGKDSPSPDILEQYRAHVKAVAGELRPPEVPAYCRKLAAQGRVAAAATSATPAAAAAGGQGKESSALAAAQNLQLQQQQEQAAAQAGPASSSGASGQTGREAGRPGFGLSREAQARLATQAALQAELGEELLGMTAELKAGALAMQNAIRQRGAILDDAETALVDSTANAQQVASKAKEQYKTSRSNFCQTCLILLVVAVLFSGMLVYIRLTSLVGITGRP